MAVSGTSSTSARGWSWCTARSTTSSGGRVPTSAAVTIPAPDSDTTSTPAAVRKPRLLADMHSEAVNGQRGASRTRIDAGFIREAFRLPELERPLDPQVRHTMLGWLED